MGYVDYDNMLKSYYELYRKSHKWWYRIFFDFVDVSVVNSYILFKGTSQGTIISLKQFKISVATRLVGLPSSSPIERKPLYSG